MVLSRDYREREFELVREWGTSNRTKAH